MPTQPFHSSIDVAAAAIVVRGPQNSQPLRVAAPGVPVPSAVDVLACPAVSALGAADAVRPPSAVALPVPVAASGVRVAQAPTTAAAPVPAWFKTGFETLDIDLATIRSTLSRGRTFAADVDAKLQEILGAPLRAGGLEALFTRAWPSAVWVASYEEVYEALDMPQFTLSALDRLGKVIFDVTICFTRDTDGAVDMHAAGADVDREHRGFGITAYAELMREKILQAYSTHPQARLSLQASNAVNANTGAGQSASGFYLHALRGYMLADSQDIPALPYPRNTPDGEADRDLSQLALLAKYFKRWVQKQQPSLSDFDCTALTSVCAQPYDYTQMTLGGQPVGRAWLLSGEAPGWNGVHFVNPPAEVTAGDEAARQRHRSKQVWDRQLGQEMAAARQRGLALRQSLWEHVNGTDDAKKAQAYTAIGMLGHPHAVDFLEGRLQDESTPRMREIVREAIACVRGDKVDAGLQQAADDPARPEVTREEMRRRLAARKASSAQSGAGSSLRPIK